MVAQKVLIIEDDVTLGEALRAAFSRNGTEATLIDKIEEADSILQSQGITHLYIDCLLPGGSGVDFVESIRKRFPASRLNVILMSGIFTDTTYIKDALRSTQALSFLKKPFDLSEALKFVKKAEAEKNSGQDELSPRQVLYSMFRKEKVTVREKRKVIEALDQIHGFDLPFIYSLLSESKMSGHLNIAGPQGEISGISFSQGNIVAVDVIDQQTYLGNLLIESGYILPDDLSDVLNIKSSKRIGERLIQGHMLSPHAFNIVLINQMSIRLSRTITDSDVTINFVETEVEMSSPCLDSESLVKFLHDWVAGKITHQWLRTHYLQWGAHNLEYSYAFSETNPALQMPLVTKLPDFLKVITSGKSLNEIVDEQIFPEEPFYKAIHFLLTKGLLVISEGASKKVIADFGNFLKKISDQFNSKNKVEIFGLMAKITNVPDDDTQKVYSEFIDLLGQPNPGETPEITNGRSQMRLVAKEAFDFVTTGNRERIKEDIAKSELEMKLKANVQFDEAQGALQKGQYSTALQILQKALLVDPSHEHGKIYLAWARLGLLEGPNKGKAGSLKEVEMDLMQVPPEEKFDALYNFVMGLFYRVSGDLVAAKKSFEKAVNMDPSLIAARRELTRTMSKDTGKKDVLNRDLKDLVSTFFGKKK